MELLCDHPCGEMGEYSCYSHGLHGVNLTSDANGIITVLCYDSTPSINYAYSPDFPEDFPQLGLVDSVSNSTQQCHNSTQGTDTDSSLKSQFLEENWFI